MNLSEVRAIVTGGARGMGRCFTEQFKQAGAKVVFCDVSAEGVQEASLALDVPGIVADVSNEADVARLFDEATEALGGPVNVLVNNAGILRDGLLIKKDRESGAIKRFDKSKWDAVIAVNLTGPFLCAREFAARCAETGTKPAVLVNMSSISRAGNMGQTNYSAAKAGLVADTKLWAGELARYGIRTGAIAPGFVDTPILQGMPPEMLGKLLKGVPLRRAGSPVEMFQAVKFIIECDYFTGRCIDVDGGLTI
jgi:3-oxoacyl-[acyl-carrier protein] reductase